MNTIESEKWTIAPQRLFGSVSVGAFTCLLGSTDAPLRIGANVTIGHHVVLHGGIDLADEVGVDSYCEIRRGSEVGAESQLLYGAKIFEEVVVGKRCIIGSSIANWTVIGDDVTFMGGIVHLYNKPGTIQDWNSGKVASPIIGDRCVVSEGALLVGGISIGSGSFIGIGETVKCDVPPDSVFLRGKIRPIADFRGYISARPRPLADNEV